MSSSDSHMMSHVEIESNEVKPCNNMSSSPVAGPSSVTNGTGMDRCGLDDDIKLCLMNRKLTAPSSAFPSRRPHVVLPSRNRTEPLTSPNSAISGTYNNNLNTSQDVVFPISALSATFNNPSLGTRNVNNQLESQLSSANLPRHGLTNQSSTPSRVFTNTSELAAHYGLPIFLPPRPATQPQRRQPPSEFESLSQNYLTMLSQSSAPKPAEAATGSAEHDALYRQMEASISPEMPDYSEFLTSPYEDSPASDFLETPLMGTLGGMPISVNSSPMLDMYSPMFEDEHGFEGGDFDFGFDTSSKPASQSTIHPHLTTVSPLWTMSSSFPSPQPTSSILLPTTTVHHSRPRKATTAAVTGTRKNVTPETLVPIDAPTQPRKYVAPSATSRKEVPVGFARKRARSQVIDEDADELDDYQLPPNPTEQQLIEAKRRQNTVAARRSRKRKLEHQRQLEDENAQATHERDVWRHHAQTLEALLHSHGIPAPPAPTFTA